MMGYADDYVLLVDTPFEMSRKLNAPFLYCKLNKLNGNIEKTKIMIFTRSPTTSARDIVAFKYGEGCIEVLNDYVYLGVNFHRSGSYSSAVKKANSAANTAVGSILKTIQSVKIDS